MTSTAQMRRQHDELDDLARKLLDVAKAGDHELTRKTLAALTGLLSVHAAAEDYRVYPRLAAHSDASIREGARRIAAEFGDLKRRLDEFTQRWLPRGTIEAAPAALVVELRAMMASLAERVAAEERYLYEPLDALDRAAVSSTED